MPGKTLSQTVSRSDHGILKVLFSVLSRFLFLVFTQLETVGDQEILAGSRSYFKCADGHAFWLLCLSISMRKASDT